MRIFCRKKRKIESLVERSIEYRGYSILISIIDHPDDKDHDKATLRLSWSVDGYGEYTLTQASDLARLVHRWKDHAEAYIDRIIDRPKIIQTAIDQLDKYL